MIEYPANIPFGGLSAGRLSDSAATPSLRQTLIPEHATARIPWSECAGWGRSRKDCAHRQNRSDNDRPNDDPNPAWHPCWPQCWLLFSRWRTVVSQYV